jgi:deoxycytidine triphosphate deaminase/plasmid maintenance system antidote protein VapI
MEQDDLNRFSKLGQYLKEYCIDRKNGLTISALAIKLGISRQLLYLVMTGKQPLSPSLAMQLSGALGNTIEFWLKLGEVDINKSEYPDFYLGKSKEEVLLEWAKMGSRTLVDKDIGAAYKRKIIDIDPFDVSSVHSLGYHLRIGTKAVFSDSEKTSVIDLIENKEYAIETGSVVTLKSYEKIVLPKYLMARYGPITDLSAFGIFLTHTSILEPEFDGYIQVTLFNPGKHKFIFSQKRPFLSIEFMYLPLEPYLYREPSNTEKAELKKTELKTINRN